MKALQSRNHVVWLSGENLKSNYLVTRSAEFWKNFTGSWYSFIRHIRSTLDFD